MPSLAGKGSHRIALESLLLCHKSYLNIVKTRAEEKRATNQIFRKLYKLLIAYQIT